MLDDSKTLHTTLSSQRRLMVSFESLYIQCQVALKIGYHSGFIQTFFFFYNRHVDSNIYNKDGNNKTTKSNKSKYTENSSHQIKQIYSNFISKFE